MDIKITLKNISQNIGIPQKVVSLDNESCEIDFRYVPVAPNEEFSELVTISSVEPYGVNAKIALFYMDIYNNTYKMKVEFLLHSKEALSNTCVIYDDIEK